MTINKTKNKIFVYYKNGTLKTEVWHDDGKPGREDGPAIIEYYKDGKIKHKIWVDVGESSGVHREDGPAEIYYNELGKITKRKWNYKGYCIKSEKIKKMIINPIPDTFDESQQNAFKLLGMSHKYKDAFLREVCK